MLCPAEDIHHPFGGQLDGQKQSQSIQEKLSRKRVMAIEPDDRMDPRKT
jgi:hypothetical protein